MISRTDMDLKTRITEDMKAAMRAKDAPRLSTLRLLLAAIKQREIDTRAELADAEVLAIVEKQIKQRRDSIAQYETANRPDLVQAETYERDLLATYLPRQLSEEEIREEVAKAVAETGARGPADMGKVMGLLKARLAGRADLGRVSALVKAGLSG